MFKSARLKLTVWYVVIIMLVSMLFSLVIYQGINQELWRFEHYQQIRIEREQQGLFPPPPIHAVDIAMIEESRQRLTWVLLLINLGILILSAAAAYFLSGRTLQPIQEMMDEQNRFISDASHELRTPLTALRSEIEVSLRDKKFSLGEAKDLLKSNLEEVVSLQTLSDKLMEIVKYQTKNDGLLIEKLTLAEITDTALKKIMPLARVKQITVNKQMRNYELEGDKQSLTELLVALLDNAVKYSEKNSSVLLTAQKIDSFIIVSVKDQGRGINQEDLPHIFDRFYRTDKSRTKENVNGYGLGLSIAKKIAERHKGEIKAESQLGKGSKFMVKLPTKLS